jgi:probable F420-dependent oxidoreductase
MNLGKLALSLPVPGDVAACLDWSRQAEDLGYESIWIAETGGPDPFVLAGAVAQVTKRVRIGLAVSPVYIRTPATIAAATGTVSQLAAGRFILGLGASSHAIVENWHGTPFKKPLTRVRETVTAVRGMLEGKKVAIDGQSLRTRGFRLMVPPAGPVPIYVGALRPAMLELAGEIGDGVVFANAARSHMRESLAALPATKSADRDFFVGNMLPVCISDDRAAAMERSRKTLVMYVSLPNYRNYWREAGYVEEMDAIQKTIEAGERDKVTQRMSDRWLADVTLFGTAVEVREGVEAWFEAGVRTPILVPSSAAGNQLVAFSELFAAYA